MREAKDQYDKAIDYLTKNPREIFSAWMSCDVHAAGCLFSFCQPVKESTTTTLPGGKECGCLTMIRQDPEWHTSFAFADEIASDRRLPKCGSEIKLSHLPVFAEWQRKLDAKRAELESTNA